MKIRKMKAAVLVETHQALVVTEVELPGRLEFGQVLVKVHYSGICASQIHEIEATKGPDNYLPHLMGHEGSATVLEVGPGVRTVKPGDKVVMHWRQGSGLQAEPANYRWNGRKLNSGWVTTFNEYAVVSENRLTGIPPDFDLKLATLFGCAITTGFGVVNNDAQVKIGQSVVVFGLGGVGLSVVQAASLVSAYPIIGVDILDEKLTMAKSFGATHCFNSKTTAKLDSHIDQIVGPRGVDAVIETTGITAVIEKAYQLAAPQGKTILVGVPRIGENVSIYTLPLHFKKILKGSHGGDSIPHIDIHNFIRLFNAGKLKLGGLITHEFELNQIDEAVQQVRSGKSGRVLVGMGH
jgi:S-(hydroxymethyl)glutathione dehydrogenase/alcohol dehydrogenase